MQATRVPGVELLRAHFVQHSFERHSHEEWCIGVTFAGHQTFRCRGEIATSHRGNVIVFRPDDAHDGHGEDESGFTYAMLYVPDARVSDWLQESGPSAAGPRIRQPLIDDPECAEALASAVVAATQPGEALRGETLLSQAVIRLFARHASHKVRPVRERTAPSWLRTVREYMEAHYSEDVSVESLARLAQVSRVHLTRAFAQIYGVPPHVHLNAVRLRAAKALLAGGVPIAEVASGVGYADQSHLTRRFKGSFGLTPSTWVRQMSPRKSADPSAIPSAPGDSVTMTGGRD